MKGIKRIKALVVDDDKKWRNALSAAMTQFGFAVRHVDDAQLAIEHLQMHKDIKVLILDWDLRGSSPALPTATGEDVLREVIDNRKDLIVVIVTGALHDPDYRDWIQSLGIDPVDESFRMSKWRPFDLIPKKDLEPELNTGLDTFINRLSEAGLTEKLKLPDSASEPEPGHVKFEAVPPYQFLNISNMLIAGNGGQLTLPQRYAHVIRKMLDRDPLNKKSFITELDYYKIAESYLDGWIEEQRLTLDQDKLKHKEHEKKKQIEKDPRSIAHQFARDFRRFLKGHGITERDAIIRCDKKNRVYRIGDRWHQSKPLLDRSEVPLFFPGKIE